MSNEKNGESMVEETIPLKVSHSEILEQNRKRWPDYSAAMSEKESTKKE